jgi:hypothetical protein
MPTIAQYATSHNINPSEIADFLNIGSSYSDGDQLTSESLDALEGGAILAEEIASYLTEWGFDYTADGPSITVGDWTAKATRGLPRATATITGPTGDYETGDAERAAMLLTLPIARTIWDMGRDNISVEYFDRPSGEAEVAVGDDVTLRTPYDEAGTVIISDHPLGISGVAMTDLAAIFESAELAYGDPLAAWQTLCVATDFEQDSWEQTVEAFRDDARLCEGDRFTSVDSYRSEGVALVEDWQEDAPFRVIDAESASDYTYWSPQDVAAAVLSIIA